MNAYSSHLYPFGLSASSKSGGFRFFHTSERQRQLNYTPEKTEYTFRFAHKRNGVDNLVYLNGRVKQVIKSGNRLSIRSVTLEIR